MCLKTNFTLPVLLGMCLLLSFAANAQYVVNGNAAVLGSSSFRLTEAKLNQHGSVWFQNKINLDFDFVIEADLNFGTRNADGADGIAFVLQPICTGLGTVGEGIGYEGINPSIAIEYDTWRNTNRNDPAEDHISMQRNGIVTHGIPDNLVGPISLPELENGAAHHTIIEWKKSTNTFQVTLDGIVRIIQPNNNIVANVFGNDPQVFWGFTAATGAAFNVQTVSITSVIIKVETPYTIQSPTCPNSSDGAINLAITGGASPYTYSWSNGATTEDLNNISPGTYTATATDKNGCKSRYTITLTGTDTKAPTISCPSDMVVNTDPNLCTATVAYTAPLGADNCTGQNTLQINGLATNANFPKGITTNIFQVTDIAGLKATCQFTVTVKDNQPPAITCPANLSVNTDLNLCSAKVTYGTPVGTDNCSGQNTVRTNGQASGAAFPEGVTTTTFTVTDAAGLASTCQFTVTVTDKQVPAITCPANLSLSCEMSTVPNMTGIPNTSDNCGVGQPTFTDNVVDGSCAANKTITRTWRVEDVHANTSTCNQIIRVQDATAPTIICPPNITVTCNTEPAITGTATALDNCDANLGMAHADHVTSGDCAWLCVTERTWTTVDDCGNSKKCVQKITKNTLPLLEDALNMDVTGDGVADGIVMGYSNSTVTILPGSGACIQKWLPYTGTLAPTGLKFGNPMVGTNCLPGTNLVDVSGHLRNPLFAEALRLTILVRLKPALGTTQLSTLSCTIHPIILQALAPNPNINELLRVTNLALGNIALAPPTHMKFLLDALKCVNGPLDICK